jgi:uncharacterized repeat protein (TIGR01451 family)
VKLRRVVPLMGAVAVIWLMIEWHAGGVVAEGQIDTAAPVMTGQWQIRLCESSESRIVIDVDVAQYVLTQQSVNGISYDVISLPEWGLTSDAGHPQLPMRRVLVGIPLDAQIQLDVISGQPGTTGPYEVLPAPEIVLLTDPLDQLQPWLAPPEIGKRYAALPGVYGADAFYPGPLASIGDVGFVRNQRVAAIELHPVQYNPVSRQMRFYPDFRIQLSFSYPQGRSPRRSLVPESAVYEHLLESQLLNYDSAKEWRGRKTGLEGNPQATASTTAWPLPSTAYKVVVTQDGLYQLTQTRLAAAGVPVGTFDPRTIQVYGNGQELAIRVVGEEDGVFDPTDYVLFYGQGIRNKYTDRNVYWLTYGHAMGRRMPERDGRPVGAPPTPQLFTTHSVIERDLRYSNLWPGEDSFERWYWEVVSAPETYTVTGTVELGHVSDKAVDSSLWVHMWGYNEVNHHGRFYVNNHLVGEHWWYGIEEAQWVSYDFPQSFLKDGENTIAASFPGDMGAAELVLFDRFELDYGHTYEADNNQLRFSQVRTVGTLQYHVTGFTTDDIEVYDISSPITVTRIISLTVDPGAPYSVRFNDTIPMTRTYLALTSDKWLQPTGISLDSPSDLRNPANGADYIVISHHDFLAAAQTLANYRAGQGLRTRAVDVEDVYDEFGYGLSTPEAIREFLRYAFDNWQPPAPTYVVLLGDGNFDPKKHISTSATSYFPPYLAFVDTWLGETAADNRYVSIAGDDIWPDLVLGRLPANSLAEATEMVDKTIDYEQGSAAQDWNGHLVFVADNPDTAGNFPALSDALVQNHVPSPYSVTKLYLGQTCASGAECRQRLVSEINSGALLVNYIGHGAIILWAGEHLLDLPAIDQMVNAGRYPIMLPMTCLEGYYIWPYAGYASLGESLVRAPQKGAVASWSPTGLGVAYGHDYLNKGFLDALLSGGIRAMGPATYAGKWRLYEAGVSLEQIEEYIVFGDPALRVHSLDVADLRVAKTVESPAEVTPGSVLTFTLTFTNAGPDVATGVVLTDLMPSLIATPTVVYSSSVVLSQKANISFAWAIADLLPHSGGEVRIRGVVDEQAQAPIAFFNMAEITSVTPELKPWNNRSYAGVGTTHIYLPVIMRKHQ